MYHDVISVVLPSEARRSAVLAPAAPSTSTQWARCHVSASIYSDKRAKTVSCNRPWRSISLRNVVAQRWRCCKPHAPTAFSSMKFPLRSGVRPRNVLQVGRLRQVRNPTRTRDPQACSRAPQPTVEWQLELPFFLFSFENLQSDLQWSNK
jgi:hypothetical protein